VTTRLSIISVVVFLAVLWSPDPRAATPQTLPDSPTAQTQPQGRQEAPARGAGQTRRGAWWKNPEIMKEIGITPEQSKKIDDLFHKRLPEAMAQEREFKKQDDELNRLLRERTVGADVIAVQVDRVEAQRTSLNKTRTVMIYQMYQVLSAEQYAKLVAYNARRANGRGTSFR